MRQTSHPQKLSGIAVKLLSVYKEWHIFMRRHLEKSLRYSLGIKIDGIFTEIAESVAMAQFSVGQERTANLTKSIVKTDTLKFMFYVLLELDGIDDKNFLSLSLKIEEVGKMLYGWKRQEDINRPAK